MTARSHVAAHRESRKQPHHHRMFEGSNPCSHHRCGGYSVERAQCRVGERDCSWRGTATHPSLTLGTALRASSFAPQSCRTKLVSCSRVRIPPTTPRAVSDVLRRVLAVNSGGREGFIPAPGELVSKGFFELPEYPYLRKYLATKRKFRPLPRLPFLSRQDSRNTDCMHDYKYAVQDRRSNTHGNYTALYEGRPE